jgi:hypothetical protein
VIRPLGLTALVLLLAPAALAGAIGGRVFDETGQPLGGVEISVHDPVRDQWVVVETSPGGRFTASGHWDKPISLLARKEGYLDVELEAVGPIVRDLRIVMRKPGRLAGRIVDMMGNPLKQRVFVNLCPLHPELAAGILRVESDAQGRFVFEGLRDGWYDVLCVPRHGPPGLLRGVRVPATGPAELMLPSARTVAVHLHDAEGAPVPPTRVRIRYLSERWALGRPPMEALTKPNGQAVIDGLPGTGAAVLIAEVEGAAPVVRRIDLAKDQRVEVRVGPGSACEVKGPGSAGEGDSVRMERSQGLPGATGTRERSPIARLENLAPGVGLLTAELDGITHYHEVLVRPGRVLKTELGSVPGKPLELEVSVDGAPATGTWLLLSKKRTGRGARGSFEGGTIRATGLATDPARILFKTGEVVAMLEVKPGRKGRASLDSRAFRAKVLADGKVARGALVLLVPPGSDDAPDDLRPAEEPTRTDSSGGFETPRFAGEGWSVLLLDEAHAPKLVPIGKEDDGGEIALAPSALLTVVVVGPEGRPILDARVHARGKGGRRRTYRPRRTDMDGRALLLLEPGTWNVDVEVPDLGRATARVKLPAEGAQVTLTPAFR